MSTRGKQESPRRSLSSRSPFAPHPDDVEAERRRKEKEERDRRWREKIQVELPRRSDKSSAFRSAFARAPEPEQYAETQRRREEEERVVLDKRRQELLKNGVSPFAMAFGIPKELQEEPLQSSALDKYKRRSAGRYVVSKRMYETDPMREPRVRAGKEIVVRKIT